MGEALLVERVPEIESLNADERPPGTYCQAVGQVELNSVSEQHVATAILFNDTSWDDHHGCALVVDQINRLAAEAGIRIVHQVPLRHDWRSDAWLQKRLQQVDLCLINGEGTLHDDLPAATILVELAAHCARTAQPCVLLNSLWQNNPKLAAGAALFTRIYVRDARSRDELAERGVAASVVPDLTLSLSPPAPPRERRGWLLNGSVLPAVQRQCWETLAAQTDPAVGALSLRRVPPLRWRDRDRRYWWRSLRESGKHLRHWLSACCLRLPPLSSAKGLSRRRWRNSRLSSVSLLAALGSAQGVVSGRFHLLTLSLLCETPCMALASNSHKIEALFEAVGLEGRMCSDYADGLRQVQLRPFSEAERLRIRGFLQSARGQARQMFDEIAALVARQS